MSENESRGGGRKMVIVLLLVGGMILLYRFATRTVGFDPSSMLALGFVVLASYGFGQLVGRLKLPHLTGYILAGLALGPSAAHLLPQAWRLPPFDQGVLSESVIDQLRPLELLAVGLIALTAGGELRTSLLRRGLGSIMSMIGGRLIVVAPVAFGFMLAISGWIPALRLPGLPALEVREVFAMAMVVGAVAISTSPAAAVAVVTETRSAGSVTGTALASVVLNDALIVVLFTLASAMAGNLLGQSGNGDLGIYLLQHVAGSVVAGVVVGLLMILYLRFVQAERLLFLLGTVFAISFLAQELHLEPVLLFIAAGFVVANFSAQGEALLKTVERLFLPVSVVFFTLAGARLHLDVVAGLAPFALALVAARAGATYVGTRTALGLTRAPDPIRRFAWTSFLPQAGVALALAGIVGSRFGPAGRTFETLLVAAISLNELIGPVAFKLALMGSGEVGGADRPATAASPEPEPGIPSGGGSEDETWGVSLSSGDARLDGAVGTLETRLAKVALEVAFAPLTRLREDALSFVRDLRREFLRYHRRISMEVLATGDAPADAAQLRLVHAELAEKWRGAIFARAARASEGSFETGALVNAVEPLLDRLPEIARLRIDPRAGDPQPNDGTFTRLRRGWLRARQALSRVIGTPTRDVEAHALARYHLWGRLPEELERATALISQADAQLIARLRPIAQKMSQEYDALAEAIEAARASEPDEQAPALGQREIEPWLRGVREQIDEGLAAAQAEIEQTSSAMLAEIESAIGGCLRDFKSDVMRVGTPDLPSRRRATSRLFRRREGALRSLDRRAKGWRETSSALYRALALEMELLGLESRTKEVLEARAHAVGRDMRGRVHRQLKRVHDALAVAAAALGPEIHEGAAPDALTLAMRRETEPVLRTAAEATRAAQQMRDQLADEAFLGPLLETLVRSAQALSDRCVIPARAVVTSEDHLPVPPGVVEVPFREWVLVRIETSLAPSLAAAVRDLGAQIEPVVLALSELERRISFNLELAVAELALVEGTSLPRETRKLVEGTLQNALERNVELFSGHVAQVADWGEQARQRVRGAVIDRLAELRAGLLEAESGRLRSKMMRDVRGRALARRVSELRGAVLRSAQIIARAARETIGESRLDAWRLQAGLLPRQAHELGLGETPANPELPIVYRRLFTAPSLEGGDVLPGRDQQLARALVLLAEGTLRCAAVVGPDGVGKSALINAIARARRWQEIVEIDLDAPATIERVDAIFARPGEGQLIVVSGLQWLRSIRPGGAAPLRRFVEGVIANRGKNAYLLRCDALVWAQSCELAPLEQAFPELVRVEPLSFEELEAAVLARHSVSGYGLVFRQGEPPQSRLEELALQATAPLSRPQQGFFRALHAASGGILRDALRLWLASVERVDAGEDLVHLGLVPEPSLHALRMLTDPDVVVLYQIARQGWMSAEVLAPLLRMDVLEARARLLALAQRGILHERSAWRVAAHLRGPVQRLLRERGYVR